MLSLFYQCARILCPTRCMLHALSVVKCIGFTFKDEDSNSVDDEYICPFSF